MKKALKIFLVLLLVVAMLAVTGCSEAEKPADGGQSQQPADQQEGQPSQGEGTGDEAGDLKTGLGVITSLSGSKDAGEKNGVASTATVLVGVLVDKDGVIQDCVIDELQANIEFSADGKIATDMATEFSSKMAIGADYGMKGVSSIGKEWDEQAKAFADYVKGKTLEQVKGIALSEGKAADADLAASITVYLGNFIGGVEKAVANAQPLGAKTGDTLGLAASAHIQKSKDVADGKDGLAQSYATYSLVSKNAEGKVTSCVIDSTQGNVNFDATGKITSDINAECKTKIELGADYGMKKASAIGKEWDEQAKAFAEYVKGKTAEEIKGISLTEGKATDADLAASVSITITPLIDLTVKALQ